MMNPFHLPSRKPSRKVWDTVYGPKAHTELAGALFELAADCARHAIEEPPSDHSGFDRWIRLTAIGQAGEMLLKATLAGIDPVLLVEKNTNTQSLLVFSGDARKLAQGKIATVGGIEALKRLVEFKPNAMKGISDPKFFDVRNDAQHLALSPTDEVLDAALTDLVAMVDWVFKIRAVLHQSTDLTAFWSPRLFGIVEARRKAGYEGLREHYRQVIGEAKSAYNRLVTGLSDNERIRIVGELEERPPIMGGSQTARKRNCPACGNYMWVVYEVLREIEMDESGAPDGVAFIAKLSGTVTYAECPVCNLYLEPENLALTDVEFTVDLGEEKATADEAEGYRDMLSDELWKNAEYADLGPADYDYGDHDEGPDEDDGPDN